MVPSEVLVLDLDGTLYPIEGALTGIIDARTTSFLLERSGLGLAELIALESEVPSILEALDRLNLSRSLWAHAVYADLPYAELPTPDQQLRAALAEVNAQRIIVTMAPLAHAESVLLALELRGLFTEIESIYGTESVTKSRVYEALVKRSSEPEKIVVIGDNPRLDLEPAAALGCRVALIGEPCASPYATYPTVIDALTAMRHSGQLITWRASNLQGRSPRSE